MKITQISLNNAFVIKPEKFTDERGFFTRIFCEKELQEILDGKRIVQVNHSLTRRKGTLRGMHFQYPPKAEVKIVKCLRGCVFDVIVDLRWHSSSFLKWYGKVLSAENMKMMFVPECFAHGFQTLEEDCELLYFHTDFYSSKFEGAIRYNDPIVGIQWPLDIAEISERDKNHPLLPKNYQGIQI